MRDLIESAFLAGYEPSVEGLEFDQMYEEAQEYLLKLI